MRGRRRRRGPRGVALRGQRSATAALSAAAAAAATQNSGGLDDDVDASTAVLGQTPSPTLSSTSTHAPRLPSSTMSSEDFENRPTATGAHESRAQTATSSPWAMGPPKSASGHDPAVSRVAWTEPDDAARVQICAPLEGAVRHGRVHGNLSQDVRAPLQHERRRDPRLARGSRFRVAVDRFLRGEGHDAVDEDQLRPVLAAARHRGVFARR